MFIWSCFLQIHHGFEFERRCRNDCLWWHESQRVTLDFSVQTLDPMILFTYCSPPSLVWRQLFSLRFFVALIECVILQSNHAEIWNHTCFVIRIYREALQWRMLGLCFLLRPCNSPHLHVLSNNVCMLSERAEIVRDHRLHNHVVVFRRRLMAVGDVV